MDQESKDYELSERSQRSARGRQSYQEGYSFEDRVAELYRLLHYKVEHGRLFSGRQVDLFLTGCFGDLTIHRAIECKVGQVKSEHIDSFIAKLRLVRREYPAAQGTIVSGLSFSNAVASQAAQEGIQLTLYRDLAAQLFDGHAYANNIIREAESNERYPRHLYIEPYIGYDIVGDGNPAFEIIDEWLHDSDWNQLTLLGDVGTGKSFISRMIGFRLATKFLENPLENPLPIRIDLRNADREFSLEGLILTHLTKNGLSQVNFDIFEYSLSQGHIVLILDGFDEMAARITPQVTSRNFFELARAVNGRAKVLLTCRTHYFKNRTEEEEVILGSSQDYGSETARDLYWELISRKGFKIAYLRSFEISQIEAYVSRAKPFSFTEAIKKIRSTYNLLELSQRPLLLEMIVKSLDKLTVKHINTATLYEVFTDAWVHRDKWRDVLSPNEKLTFLMALARSLWDDDAPSIHYTRLFEYVHQRLASQIQDAQLLIEIDSEIRTASFLTRDGSGYYGFAHKSYAEFFLARYLAQQLNSGCADCLHTRRLSPEIAGFMIDIVDLKEVESLLEAILLSEYKPLISENALVCLYGFRRAAALGRQVFGENQDSDSIVVGLPPNMKLNGAQLDQVTLEAATMVGTDFSGANLTETVLTHTDLSNSNLVDANLEKARLDHSILCSAAIRSACLIKANLEKADLSGADLNGSNLSESYLLQVIHEGTNFNKVIWHGAILPEELQQTANQYTYDKIKNTAEESNNPITDEYWKIIERLYPFMIRITEASSFTSGFDPGDVVSDVIIRLAAPAYLEKITRLSEAEQERYIFLEIKNTLRARYTRSNREVLVSDLFEFDKELYGNDPGTVNDSRREVEDTLSKRILIAKMKSVLSKEAWHILEDYALKGISIEEIAARESKSVRTIRRMLSKSKEILREHLVQEYSV